MGCRRFQTARPQSFRVPITGMAAKRILKTLVPSIKQILPPLIVRPAHEPHDVAAGVEVEGAGFAHQLHSGFGWELVALAAVAVMAAGYEILPGGGTSAGAGEGGPQGHCLVGQHGGDILTGVAWR